jgi:hypothetical protein
VKCSMRAAGRRNRLPHKETPQAGTTDRVWDISELLSKRRGIYHPGSIGCVNDASEVIPFYAVFFALAAVLAIIASLERILGRPIPRLRHSRAVSKNRTFWAVPILMVAVTTRLWFRDLTMIACSHCSPPYVWQHPRLAALSLMVTLGFSGAVGWIVYFLLLICALVARLFFRPARIL